MSITNTGMTFSKIEQPRAGWFDGICDLAAKHEATNMEMEFNNLQDTCLDDWEYGDEW